MDPMPRRCSNSNSMPGVMKMSNGNPERSTQPAAMSHAAKMSTLVRAASHRVQATMTSIQYILQVRSGDIACLYLSFHF